MANLGELFIQLGVIGDIKPLEDALNKAKEQIALTQTQVKLDNARAKALEKIRQATTRADKQRIAKAYQTEKQLIMQKAQEAGINRQITAHKALGQTVGKVATGFAAFIGAVTAAAVAMNKLTNDLVQSNQAFLNLTRTSDIALSTFQKWDNVGKMFGVQNAAQQIEGLNQRLFELRLTGQGARGFQLAGINPAGDAESVLEQLRSRVSGMSDTSASYLLQQMGLDPQMLHLLRLGREKFEALGQTVRKYQLTPEQSKNIQQMNVQLQIAAIKLQYLKDRAVLALMPAWVELVKSFVRVTEMLARVGKRIGEFSIKWRSLIGVFALGLSRIKNIQLFFKGISTALSSCITKIPIFGRLFVALGGTVAKALIPLTALYLLLDDFAVYKAGGDSVIGDFMNWKNQQGTDWNNIGQTFQSGDITQGIKDTVIKLIVTIDDFIQELARWLHVLTGLPFDKWAQSFARFMSNNTIEKARNYDYSHGQATGAAAGVPPNGYEGTLPNLSHRGIVSPATEQIINNNNNTVSSTTSNPQITQTNYIQTNQPANDIERELRFINAQFA